MATPNQSSGQIPSNLSPAQILHLIATNPELLNETERQLSQDQKISIIHNKIMRLFQQQKAKQAQSGQASGSSPAPAAGQAQAQAKRGPGRPPAQQQQGQQIPNRAGQQGQMQQPQGQVQGQGQGQQVQGNQPVCIRYVSRLDRC
jgi:hypothetical protein